MSAPIYFFLPALLILYYLAARYWIRSHSEPGATVTQYTPPQNLAAGTLRYLVNGEFDAKCIAATVVHLAALGLVTFRGMDEFYVISRTEAPVPPDISPEELALYKKMFHLDQGGREPFPGRLRTYDELPKDAFLLPPMADEKLKILAATLYDALKNEYKKPFLSRHLLYAIPPAVISVYLICGNISDDALRWFLTLCLPVAIIALSTPGGLANLWNQVLNAEARKKAVLQVCLVVGLGVFVANSNQLTWTLQLLLLLVVFLNLTLPGLLSGPTKQGRRLLDEIDGYRDFLSSVELDRMHRLKTPGWKPSAATANLAYAIALDLGDSWDEYVANGSFRTVVWEGSPTKGGPREIRTAPESAWVDHWSGWVAFAILMGVVACVAYFITGLVDTK